ncbi:hypothetical protein N9051_02730, partial [Akkermansiaceae bacterium]|nr:hypothetical protein [Akkermansiaceae bacterium]
MNRRAFYLLPALLISCQPEEVKKESFPETVVAWTRAEWPVARGGAALSGTVGDPVIPTAEIAWTFKTEGPIAGEAIISGDSIVFGNDLGIIYVLDFETGELRWE